MGIDEENGYLQEKGMHMNKGLSNSGFYAGSKCCQSLDMCTAFAKPCEYARRRQMSR